MRRLSDMNVASELSTREMRLGVMKSRIRRANGKPAGLESSEVFCGEDMDFGNGSRYQRIETP